jgi:endonuclease/exonuclease/phosphatase family metal-dependent hydrolase
MKVLTYNIQGEIPSFHKTRYHGVGQKICDIDPDIVFLQEYGVKTDSKTEFKNEYLNDYYSIGSNSRCRILIKYGSISPIWAPPVVDTFTWEGYEFPFYNMVLVHIKGIGDVLLVNFHLTVSFFGKDDTERNDQIKKLIARINEIDHSNTPTILGGDLNAISFSLPYERLIEEGFIDTYNGTQKEHHTWHDYGKVRSLIPHRIDYLFTRNINASYTYEVHTDEKKASDHYPVSAIIC